MSTLKAMLELPGLKLSSLMLLNINYGENLSRVTHQNEAKILNRTHNKRRNITCSSDLLMESKQNILVRWPITRKVGNHQMRRKISLAKNSHRWTIRTFSWLIRFKKPFKTERKLLIRSINRKMSSLYHHQNRLNLQSPSLRETSLLLQRKIWPCRASTQF